MWPIPSCLVIMLATTLAGAEHWMREALPVADGWQLPGVTGSLCTGGSTAQPTRVFRVRNRDELASALGDRKDSSPRIILVQGMIDLTAGSSGLSGPDGSVEDGLFSFAGYIASVGADPSRRTGSKASAAMEQARHAWSTAYRHHVVMVVPSDTSLIGDGPDAGLRGGGLHLKKSAQNIIIRNLIIEDAWDPFPKWDPGDGEDGNWNAEIDAISIEGAQRVWIDHCTLTDGDPHHPHADERAPMVFTRRVQHHDGLIDIKSGADLVTVSWCRFDAHDKVSMLGFSDNHSSDRGHLRTTFHHNIFLNTTQRTPRVRFGQVHLYNNLHVIDGSRPGYPFHAAWGIGVESGIVAENNVFDVPGMDDPLRILALQGGERLTATGTWLNGRAVEPAAASRLKPAMWEPGAGTSWYGNAPGPDPVDPTTMPAFRSRILTAAGATLGGAQ